MGTDSNGPDGWTPDPLWWRDPKEDPSEHIDSAHQENSADNLPRPDQRDEQRGSEYPAAPPPGWYPDPAGSRFHWWDGSNWTGATAPISHGSRIPSRPSLTSQISPKMWLLGIAGLVALVLLVGILASTSGRDELSYQAGYGTGKQFAEVYQITTRDPRSERQLEIDCSGFAAMARNREINYYSGGQIRGSEIDGDDYKDGCIDGFRAAVR